MIFRSMVLHIGQAAALVARTGTATQELDIKEMQSLLHHKYQAPFGDEERLREPGII